MPSYTFRCNDCGEFTLFFKSMAGNKDKSTCPICQLESNRVYFAPNVYSLSRALSSQIEKGMEPQIMSREELGANKPRKKAGANRPWQFG
ncbi:MULTISPECIES: zinc ribbon domain-containing protein [unclassified Lysinibacillus]|uniref:FmdB family zinc ribbon protein n=1 Tax=unclassified Lysinibacillus TaxID=2636778 RepID=UPI0035D6E4B4